MAKDQDRLKLIELFKIKKNTFNNDLFELTKRRYVNIIYEL